MECKITGEKISSLRIKLIYFSTSYVYPGTKGNYKSIALPAELTVHSQDLANPETISVLRV